MRTTVQKSIIFSGQWIQELINMFWQNCFQYSLKWNSMFSAPICRSFYKINFTFQSLLQITFVFWNRKFYVILLVNPWQISISWCKIVVSAFYLIERGLFLPQFSCRNPKISKLKVPALLGMLTKTSCGVIMPITDPCCILNDAGSNQQLL